MALNQLAVISRCPQSEDPWDVDESVRKANRYINRYEGSGYKCTEDDELIRHQTSHKSQPDWYH